MQSSLFLPQEIIINILSRLPAKSIGRCRCLSKQWRALLSEPHFIKIHLDRIRNTKLQQQQQQQSLILLFGCGSLFVLPLNLRNAHQLFDEMLTEPVTKLFFAGHSHCWKKILTSCDGLVLVENDKNNIFLINPLTREIRQVPPSPFTLGPWASYTMYALGYDSVNDDYKIVTLSYYNDDRGYGPYSEDAFVNVYSVKNGTWNKAESSPYDHALDHVTSGVFVNGRIHWLGSETTSYSSVIGAFDLAEEKFYEVPLPNSIGELAFNSLAELGGCLCMSSPSYRYGTYVWIMKEYGNKDSWIVKEFGPLCLLDREQAMLVKDEETNDAKFVKYDLDRETLKYIVVHGNSDDFEVEGTFIKSFVIVPPNGRQFTRGTFIESLVSPHCSRETS